MIGSEFSNTQRALLKRVAERVREWDFAHKADSQSFYRHTTFGAWALHLSFIRHKNDFDATADVAVRVDAIEQFVNRFADVPEQEKRNSFTIGAELGNIAEGQSLRWNISREGDIPPVVEGVCEAFASIGVPYLERFSDINSLYYVLSSPRAEDWLHSPIAGPRCMRAIACACLLRREDDLTELVRRCESLLREHDDPYLEEFRQLAGSVLNSK